MLRFDAEYFDDEVRDGFYVNGMMKRNWAAQLEILNDFDELCTKYGLRYMADWGTMLGTVRHGGFIPWDDDFDIGMPRADYEKFLEVSDELGGDYHVLCIQRYPEYEELFGRVVNSRVINMSPEHLEHFHGMPFALGMDIFPYDYLYRDEEREKERLNRYQIIGQVISLIDQQRTSRGGNYTITGDMRDLLRQIERFTGHKLVGASDLRHDLMMCLNEIVSECPENEADDIADYQNFTIKKNNYRLPKNTFDNLVALPYENTRIPVPADYEGVLRTKYWDYMKIIHGWKMHNYPYYADQRDILRQHRPEFYPLYEYSVHDVFISQWNCESNLSNLKGDIVFLPYKAKYWSTMRPAWEMLKNNPNCNVYVMPIPYYEKTWDGQHGQMHYEKDMFPEEADVISIDAYDLFGTTDTHSGVKTIIIQDARDNYGETISVHPMFYCDRLRAIADMLIYIPPFEPDIPEPKDEKAWKSMDYYVTMPGILKADAVFVGSEKMREAYIQKLVSFAGEDIENEGSNVVLELKRKVQIAPWVSKASPYANECKHTNDTLNEKKKAPEEWQRILHRPDGSYKRVILYEPNVCNMASYGGLMIDKISRSLEIFHKNADDVCVILRPVPDLETLCGVLDEEQQGKLLDILEQYVSAGWGIWDPSPDAESTRRIADAYYGDITSDVSGFIRMGKPVMIENPEG